MFILILFLKDYRKTFLFKYYGKCQKHKRISNFTNILPNFFQKKYDFTNKGKIPSTIIHSIPFSCTPPNQAIPVLSLMFILLAHFLYFYTHLHIYEQYTVLIFVVSIYINGIILYVSLQILLLSLNITFVSSVHVEIHQPGWLL